MQPSKAEEESLSADVEQQEDYQSSSKSYGDNKPNKYYLNGMIKLYHLWQVEMLL
jgi:hypothetical protein